MDFFYKRDPRKLIFSLGCILLLGVFLIPNVLSEFRFCNKGPHRIKDTDCPGGFYASTPINITCGYYAISDSVPIGSTPQIVQNYCTTPDSVELPIAGDKINPSITELQEFYIDNIDPAADPATPGQFTPTNVCQDECFIDWRDPDELDPEDHLDDKPPPTNDSSLAVEREKNLTKQIFMNLIMDDNFEEDDPQGIIPIYDPLFYPNDNSTENRLNRLLAKSMQIVLSQCGPYVEENFMRQILKAMIYMNTLNKKTMVDIGIAEYKIIDKELDKCMAMENTLFKLVGSQCGTYYKVEEIHYNFKKNWKYRIQSRSFVWNMYDPIVEAAYAVLDFVHGYCFTAFLSNFNYYHIFTVAMEGLFPENPALNHWLTPTELTKGDSFWNSVLDTGDIKTSMRNLDACAIAAYADSPYKHRLERSFSLHEMLENPKFIPINTTSSAGWTKTSGEYWSQYEARGGFKKFASEWGYCINSTIASDDIRNQTIMDLKADNCNITSTSTPSIESINK